MGAALICFVLSGLSLLGTGIAFYLTKDADVLFRTLLMTNGVISTIVWFLGGSVFVWLHRIHTAITENAENVWLLLDAINKNGYALNVKLGAVAPQKSNDAPAWMAK